MAMRQLPHKDVVFKAPDGKPLRLYTWPSDRPKAPVLFVIHGGGWCGGDALEDMEAFAPMAEALLAEGWAAATVDYRLTGPDREIRFEDLFSDVLDGLAYLCAHAEEYGADPQRVVVAGGSAGGHLALMTGLAAQAFRPGFPARVRLIVDLCGPADLLDLSDYIDSPYLDDAKGMLTMLTGVPPTAPQAAVYRRVSPYFYVAPQSPPILMVHGTVDTLAPFSQSQKLAARCLEAGVPYCLLPITYAWHDFQSRVAGKSAAPALGLALACAAEWARAFAETGGTEA